MPAEFCRQEIFFLFRHTRRVAEEGNGHHGETRGTPPVDAAQGRQRSVPPFLSDDVVVRHLLTLCFVTLESPNTSIHEGTKHSVPAPIS